MKKLIAAVAVLALSACAGITAETKAGKSYTCIPNAATDRGPFEKTPPPGEALSVVK